MHILGYIFCFLFHFFQCTFKDVSVQVNEYDNIFHKQDKICKKSNFCIRKMWF